jgi:hypothetical protein
MTNQIKPNLKSNDDKYRYAMKCHLCNSVTSFMAGNKPDYDGFLTVMSMYSPETFQYCDECVGITCHKLVGYSAND